MKRYMDIPGFPGYRVSVVGKVQSSSKRMFPRKPEVWRTLVIEINHNGYEKVKMVDASGERKQKFVHRIVLESFIGPCPEGMQCCHKNGTRTDNRLRNLRWGTPQENMQDQVRHGTLARGERSAASKLTEKEVKRILRYRLGNGTRLTQQECADMFDVNVATIRFIEKRKIWAHVKYNAPEIPVNVDTGKKEYKVRKVAIADSCSNVQAPQQYKKRRGATKPTQDTP